MIPANVALLSVGMLTITAFLPVICYLDLKYRKIPIEYFYTLATINIPVAAIIYAERWLTLLNLFTGICISIVIWFAYLAFRQGIFSGADRNLIILMIMFTFYNPFSPLADPQYAEFIAWVYQVKFFAYLFMVMCFVPLVILIYNLWKKNQYNLWDMLTKYPRGIPMTIPISAAYLITLIWGL